MSLQITCQPLTSVAQVTYSNLPRQAGPGNQAQLALLLWGPGAQPALKHTHRGMAQDRGEKDLLTSPGSCQAGQEDSITEDPYSTPEAGPVVPSTPRKDSVRVSIINTGKVIGSSPMSLFLAQLLGHT